MSYAAVCIIVIERIAVVPSSIIIFNTIFLQIYSVLISPCESLLLFTASSRKAPAPSRRAPVRGGAAGRPGPARAGGGPGPRRRGGSRREVSRYGCMILLTRLTLAQARNSCLRRNRKQSATVLAALYTGTTAPSRSLRSMPSL